MRAVSCLTAVALAFTGINLEVADVICTPSRQSVTLKECERLFNASRLDFIEGYQELPESSKPYRDRSDIFYGWSCALEIVSDRQPWFHDHYANEYRRMSRQTKDIPGPRVAGLPLPYRLRSK